MFTVMRLFSSEQQARGAADRLAEKGFRSVEVFSPTGDAGTQERVVRNAVQEGRLPGAQADVCIRSLQRSRWIVAATPPFGSGQIAIDILESCGAVETESLATEIPRNPSPFSDFLGIPVLTNSSPSTSLSIIEYTFGRPRSIRNPAPLSSLIGLKALSASKHRGSTSGTPVPKRNAAPLSSLLGLKTLTRSSTRDRETSFGFSLLSRNPTPLSSLLGLRVLSKRAKRDRK